MTLTDRSQLLADICTVRAFLSQPSRWIQGSGYHFLNRPYGKITVMACARGAAVIAVVGEQAIVEAFKAGVMRINL